MVLLTLADYDEHSIDCLMTPRHTTTIKITKTSRNKSDDTLQSGLKRCFNPAVGYSLDDYDDSNESLTKSKKLKLELLGKMKDSWHENQLVIIL